MDSSSAKCPRAPVPGAFAGVFGESSTARWPSSRVGVYGSHAGSHAARLPLPTSSRCTTSPLRVPCDDGLRLRAAVDDEPAVRRRRIDVRAVGHRHLDRRHPVVDEAEERGRELRRIPAPTPASGQSTSTARAARHGCRRRRRASGCRGRHHRTPPGTSRTRRRARPSAHHDRSSSRWCPSLPSSRALPSSGTEAPTLGAALTHAGSDAGRPESERRPSTDASRSMDSAAAARPAGSAAVPAASADPHHRDHDQRRATAPAPRRTSRPGAAAAGPARWPGQAALERAHGSTPFSRARRLRQAARDPLVDRGLADAFVAGEVHVGLPVHDPALDRRALLGRQRRELRLQPGCEPLCVGAPCRVVALVGGCVEAHAEPLAGARLDGAAAAVVGEQVAGDAVEPRRCRPVRLVAETAQADEGAGEGLGGEVDATASDRTSPSSQRAIAAAWRWYSSRSASPSSRASAISSASLRPSSGIHRTIALADGRVTIGTAHRPGQPDANGSARARRGFCGMSNVPIIVVMNVTCGA